METQIPEDPTDLDAALKLVSQAVPEPIREHWADIDGVRYPPNQTYQLISNLPRSSFTSHTAPARLRKIGFTTSIYKAKNGVQRLETGGNLTVALCDYTHLSASFATLLEFLTTNELTKHLSSAESVFDGSDMTGFADAVEHFHFSEDLLDAALAIRQHVGRLNDVIHATVIARRLPLILEPGETVTVRPSLGAGNDPSRPFDVETDRRIAEFKVSQCKSADTMRKRGVFADLVHLALDPTERRAQLFVVGALRRNSWWPHDQPPSGPWAAPLPILDAGSKRSSDLPDSSPSPTSPPDRLHISRSSTSRPWCRLLAWQMNCSRPGRSTS
ncbi:hypothetical protein N806_32990 [Rhodococcus sp. P27]|nr:hypothetical protein N806_17015 [Rhodococcus sp. P27]ERB55932.1 hypothetical protein N806_32990 [Rhodococcus sp. P27]